MPATGMFRGCGFDWTVHPGTSVARRETDDARSKRSA
jgi:hypothetical protein